MLERATQGDWDVFADILTLARRVPEQHKSICLCCVGTAWPGEQNSLPVHFIQWLYCDWRDKIWKFKWKQEKKLFEYYFSNITEYWGFLAWVLMTFFSSSFNVTIRKKFLHWRGNGQIICQGRSRFCLQLIHFLMGSSTDLQFSEESWCNFFKF